MIKQQNTYKKLPIIKIFSAALTLPKKYFKELLPLGIPLFLLWIVATILNSLNIYPNDLMVFLFGATFILLLLNTIIACHRIFLLDRQEVKSTPLIRFTFREFMYIARWIGIGIISGSSMIPLSLIFPFIDTSETLFSTFLPFLFIAIIVSPSY